MNILTLLYKHRTPMSQNEISRELYLSKQTVTSVVDSLEKRGFVTRSISEGDRRSREVTLTESGRTAGRRIGREMRRVELSAFELLSDQEQRALVDIQEKLWHGFYQSPRRRISSLPSHCQRFLWSFGSVFFMSRFFIRK